MNDMINGGGDEDEDEGVDDEDDDEGEDDDDDVVTEGVIDPSTGVVEGAGHGHTPRPHQMAIPTATTASSTTSSTATHQARASSTPPPDLRRRESCAVRRLRHASLFCDGPRL